MCSCTGIGGEGVGGGRISKTKNYEIKNFGDDIIGGSHVLPGTPPAPPLPTTFKYYQRQSQGAIPQAPGRPGRQGQGRPASNLLEPVRDRRSVKDHCH